MRRRNISTTRISGAATSIPTTLPDFWRERVHPEDLAFVEAVHVLGVVLFLGNIIVTGVWKALADRTGDPRTIACPTPRDARRLDLHGYSMVQTAGLDPLGPT